MPLLVVPIIALPRIFSLSPSSSRCQGMMTWARGSMRRFLQETPRASSPVDLPEDALGVDDHAAAQQAEGIRIEDARGDELQFIDLAAVLHRVPGVVAPLRAHHDIGARGENIDDFSLALVAPLDADNHSSWHRKAPILIFSRKRILLDHWLV